MRYITKNTLAFLLGGLVLLLTPVGSYANTSFKLQFNDRSPQVPTGRVKITLELNANPATSMPATQLTVGSTVVPLEEVFFPLPNGDEVSFLQIPGTNNVLIDYIPKSHMQVPTNFCNRKTMPSPVTFPQTVGFNFQGPTVNGFRLNSYTVGKDLPGDFGFCDQARRRVKSNAAQILPPDAGAPFPDMTTTATFLGRHPLDIVLVLDKSGSMGWDLPGMVGPPVRMTVLKDALNQFITTWEQADIPPMGSPPPGGAFAANVTGDRIGVVFFTTDTDEVSLSGNFFQSRGTNPAGPTHNWEVVRTEVGARSPTNATALGKGLALGIKKWQDDPTPALVKNDVNIILMTDGIQNVDPRVTTVMGSDVVELDPPGPDPNTSLANFRIPMQTVAIGTPLSASTEEVLLERIAKQTTGGAGIARIVATPATIATAFIDALISSVKGNTLSLLTRTENTLATGVPSSTPLPVLLDGSVRRATFVLGWEGRRQERLDLLITPPGGTPAGSVFTPVVRQDGFNWTVQSIDIPASGSIGDWQVSVVRQRSTADSGAVPYHLSAYSVEGRLDYRLTFNPVSEGTGDSMILRADVSFDGRPLSGINNGIRLKIERPNKGPGTFLHDTDVSDTVLNNEPSGVPSSPDTTTPFQRKVLSLANTPGARDTHPQELTDTFFLRDDGSAASGDVKAGDGVYAAKFSDTTRPGLYRFKVTLEWDDPRTGRIHRIENIEKVVKVNSTSQASQVTIDSKDSGTYVLKVTPRDGFGNYYGPSSVNPITVNLTGGGTVASITDPRQTGDYIIRIENVPPGADPHVVIGVDGRTIRDTNISQLTGGPNQGFKRWGLSLHAGVSIPHGNFSNIFDPGPNFAVDLEYRFTPIFSAELIYGLHHFNGTTIGGFTFSDVNVHQFSLNGKVYGSTSPLRPFFNFGGGAYHVTPSTHGGLNVGGGLQFDVTPNFAVEGMYNFHNVFLSGSNFKFSGVQGGVRFRF